MGNLQSKIGVIEVFDNFLSFFNKQIIKSSNKSDEVLQEIDQHAAGFVEMFSVYDGESFGNGLYRFHKTSEFSYWNEMMGRAFPEYKNRIHCFGYDWLGRHFALDPGRIKENMYEVLMFEPGTGEVLEIPCDFLEFHNEEIVEYHDACLASQLFAEWQEKNPTPLSSVECVGYKVPLFLGGEDILGNLEASNLDVYWKFIIELLEKVRDLPEGTKVEFGS